MTRLSFFFVVLLTFAVCLATMGPKKGFAMGTKSAFEKIRKDEIQKEQTDESAGEKNGRGEELRKDQTGGKEEKPPPEKKPRLKYRDPYECGC